MSRWLLRLGPWIAVAFLLWREQTLEAKLAEWVAKANAAMQAIPTEAPGDLYEVLAVPDPLEQECGMCGHRARFHAENPPRCTLAPCQCEGYVHPAAVSF